MGCASYLGLPMAKIFEAYGLISDFIAFISVAPVQDPAPKKFPGPALDATYTWGHGLKAVVIENFGEEFR